VGFEASGSYAWTSTAWNTEGGGVSELLQTGGKAFALGLSRVKTRIRVDRQIDRYR